MRAAIVTFPGSNCDYDCFKAITDVLGEDAYFVWHREESVGDCDLVILPGGFSYGDYLRAGAIARFSPIMKDVQRFADDGGYVLGVCNGFQVLIETGLLPGALMRNAGLKFVCARTELEVGTSASAFTRLYAKGERLSIPIAHHDGNFVADPELVARLEGADRVAFRYADNPNGSSADIAGILSENRRVLGMMPHPERAVDPLHGGTDGLRLFEGLAQVLAGSSLQDA
jgi:phosphoribosylformylglycinamidine synthase subunit PurQ / glutaminase